MDWSELQSRIYHFAKKAFAELHDKCPNEEFYAFALYTDSSAMGIGPSANSIERLNEKIQSELEGEDETPENAAYYKWASSEWAYEAVGGEFFKGINKDLSESAERADFKAFKDKVLQAMTDALDDMVKERFFDSLCKKAGKAVVFVSMTDDDESENIENASARAINPQAIYEAFLGRYDVVNEPQERQDVR
ncbi:DUF4303 domain-containing protein [Pseudomonas eucalypticola]|uniref:DUF4303 domain-containing protein n=1 Tax=Pseudomonas eucalypticola TaxID=2599595 RepID=A0A7D5D454_9PSED|nr:DUF4303 domain-containing protein [Pseudomonas eucalypticola]QKZ02416.1 DUF4303 domain-containing protein [Pseudomonas eucalypticola]